MISPPSRQSHKHIYNISPNTEMQKYKREQIASDCKYKVMYVTKCGCLSKFNGDHYNFPHSIECILQDTNTFFTLLFCEYIIQQYLSGFSTLILGH